MYYEIAKNDHGLPYDPLKGCVVPRPIGWISTISRAGVVNLAPFSFFNILSYDPPYLVFSAGGNVKDKGVKDTVVNAEETGEFVYNMATWDLREVMNASSADFGSSESEPEKLGLEMLPSRQVKPPRVARSPVHFECRYIKTVELVGSDGKKNRSSVVIGEVVGIHIDDTLIADGMVDITKARPIARLGYMDYSVVNEVFEIMRPTSPEAAIAAANRANGAGS
jgi:flavin reductase (DIM6/NTAB) family NADH-FMN oxidoreductase RutF